MRTTCLYCDTELPPRTGPGRPRVYCKPAHRQRHYEERHPDVIPRSSLPVGPIRNRRDKAYLLYIYGNECPMCSSPLTVETMEIDHVIPKSKGGESVWQNLQPLCGVCNRRKYDKILCPRCHDPLTCASCD